MLIGCAWLLYYYLPIGNQFTYFWGFFAMALILVILGLIAGLIAARAVKRGAPPTPDMAIEEARRIRDTVSSGSAAAPGAASSPGAATVDPCGRQRRIAGLGIHRRRRALPRPHTAPRHHTPVSRRRPPAERRAAS